MRCILLFLFLMIVIILSYETRMARKGRSRTKKKGSQRMIYYTHPKRKEYYDNPDGARIISSSHWDYEFTLGHTIKFICIARGNPIPRIIWFKDSIEIVKHPFLQIREWINQKEKTIKSKLEIDVARQLDSGSYECRASNKYAIDSKNFKADY